MLLVLVRIRLPTEFVDEDDFCDLPLASILEHNEPENEIGFDLEESEEEEEESVTISEPGCDYF